MVFEPIATTERRLLIKKGIGVSRIDHKWNPSQHKFIHNSRADAVAQPWVDNGDIRSCFDKPAVRPLHVDTV